LKQNAVYTAFVW